MKNIFKTSLFCSLLLASQVSSGAVYKCITADGRTVYQETPCRTENHELEIEIEQRSEIPEQEQKERKKSIKDIETFADRLYLERKIKECDEKIMTLKKSRQAAVDYFRVQLLYQETRVQVEKIKGIIESVKEEHQRKIDIKTMEKDQYEEKLRMLDK